MLCLSCRCRQPECYNSGPFFLTFIFRSVSKSKTFNRREDRRKFHQRHLHTIGGVAARRTLIFSILFSFFSGILERAAAAVHANGSIASGVALESRAK